MKRILLATDSSDYSQNAAWFLSRLPHDGKWDITIASVVNPPMLSHHAQPVDSWMREVAERDTASIKTAVKKIREMFQGANVTIKHVSLEGHVGDSLVRLASDLDADLIVLGARGHSTVSRILLGSTSDYVATHATCSVLTVRPTGYRDTDRQLRVAIATEDSNPARAALDEFCDLPWGSDADIRLISVADNTFGFFGEIEPSPEAQEKVISLLNAEAKRIRKSIPQVTTKAIESEHVGEGIVRYIEEHKCDLVVVGESPRTVVGRAMLGSVSRYVLRHSPCSVWLTKNGVLPSVVEPTQPVITSTPY